MLTNSALIFQWRFVTCKFLHEILAGSSGLDILRCPFSNILTILGSSLNSIEACLMSYILSKVINAPTILVLYCNGFRDSMDYSSFWMVSQSQSFMASPLRVSRSRSYSLSQVRSMREMVMPSKWIIFIRNCLKRVPLEKRSPSWRQQRVNSLRRSSEISMYKEQSLTVKFNLSQVDPSFLVFIKLNTIATIKTEIEKTSNTETISESFCF